MKYRPDEVTLYPSHALMVYLHDTNPAAYRAFVDNRPLGNQEVDWLMENLPGRIKVVGGRFSWSNIGTLLLDSDRDAETLEVAMGSGWKLAARGDERDVC